MMMMMMRIRIEEEIDGSTSSRSSDFNVSKS